MDDRVVVYRNQFEKSVDESLWSYFSSGGIHWELIIGSLVILALLYLGHFYFDVKKKRPRW